MWAAVVAGWLHVGFSLRGVASLVPRVAAGWSGWLALPLFRIIHVYESWC